MSSRFAVALAAVVIVTVLFVSYADVHMLRFGSEDPRLRAPSHPPPDLSKSAAMTEHPVPAAKLQHLAATIPEPPPQRPTFRATAAPTPRATNAPVAAPTETPTHGATNAPVAAPTETPTSSPTPRATGAPVAAPTETPTSQPAPEAEVAAVQPLSDPAQQPAALKGPIRMVPASRFKVGVVAFNRPKLLDSCLSSLQRVRGLNKEHITVYQDAGDPTLPPVAKKHGVKLVQHLGGARSPVGADNIAKHYKFTLSSMFGGPDPPEYAILVEDDMVFSPDFFDFFRQLVPVLLKDPSLWCISSWNDNGNIKLVDPAETGVVYRTSFFIGLGWLISRKLYKDELEPKWPSTHWDHWMREDAQRKGRECLYPEIPRNHNEGVVGVHSDEMMFEKYFRHVAFNTDTSPALGDVFRLVQDRYDEQLAKQVAQWPAVAELSELSGPPLQKVVQYEALRKASVLEMEAQFLPISNFFQVWHSIPMRGEHQGVLPVHFGDAQVLLLASDSKFAKHAKSSSGGKAHVFGSREFRGVKTELQLKQAAKKKQLVRVGKGAAGQDCNQVCKELGTGMRCDVAAFELINSCTDLEKHFGCKKGCKDSMGPDQPAMISPDAPAGKAPGVCLVNLDPKYWDCTGKWEFALRLCPCFES